MSSVLSTNGILAPSTRRNQLNRSIATRKRKLAQLYAVALSESPIPEPVEVYVRDVDASGLSAFLDQNDIEKGRYFKRSSIPTRRKYTEPPSRHSKRLAVSSRSQSPLVSLQSQLTSVHSKPVTSISPEHEIEKPLASPNADDSVKRNHHATPRGTDIASSKTRATKFQQKSLSNPPSSRQQSPSIATINQSPAPLHETGAVPFDTAPERSLGKINDAASNTIVKQRNDAGPHAVVPDSEEVAGRRLDGISAPGEPGSSASSTEGLPSTNTPRTDVHSPATSADEDHGIQKADKATRAERLRQEVESLGTSQPLKSSGLNKLPLVAPESRSTLSPSHANRSRRSPRFSRSPSPSKILESEGTSRLSAIQQRENHDVKSRSSLDRTRHDTVVDVEIDQGVGLDLRVNSAQPNRDERLKQHDSSLVKVGSPRSALTANRQPPTMRDSLLKVTGQPPPSPPMSIVDNTQDLEASSPWKGPREPLLSNGNLFSIVLSDSRRPVTPPPEDKSGLKQDYMRTMFSAQAYRDSRQASLKDLIKKSSKTLMTSDFLTEVGEQRDIRIVKRIWTMQNAHRWSLRQWKACPEPTQSATHQDYLLRQMRWLQIDFREERKFKIGVAKQLADACAKWKAADSNTRRSLEGTYGSQRLESLAGDSIGYMDLLSLKPDELHAKISEGSVSQKILEKLPLFGSLKSFAPIHLDAVIEGNAFRGTTDSSGVPPAKKRKFLNYEVNSENPLALALPPKDKNCALFDPASKHLRDRLTAPHAYKHPTDVRMPEQAFYETRAASQWTKDDDARLREFVRDCTANWALIAENMSSRSLFRSGPDRRNSWECYERLLGIETPPPEIARHPYHQQFHRRIETARQVVFAKQDALAQQYHAQNPGQSQVQFRRKFNSPSGTDRRNAAKRFLALLDASRKLARKREAAKQREVQQQGDSSIQAQRAAAMRRMQETPSQLKNAASTPQFYSNMKAEREENERKLIQQRRAYDLQRRAAAQQVGQQHALANGMAPHMRGPANGITSSQNAAAAMVSANGQVNGTSNEQIRQQVHQHPAFQMGMVNGVPTQMNVKSMSQNNLQPNIQGQQRLHPNMAAGQMQRLMQQQTQQSRALQQVSQQQLQQQQQLLQQQSMNQYANSTNININPLNGFPNSNLMTSYNHLTSSANEAQNGGLANINGSSASPQLAHQLALSNSQAMDAIIPTQPRLSSGLIPTVAHLSHQIAKQNPQFSPEQVNAIASAKLHEHFQSQKQQALNAAAGIGQSGISNGLQSQQQAYQQAGLMASGSPLQSMNQGHGQYQQQIRQQIMSQNKMATMNAQAGNLVGAMGFGLNTNRTPTPNPNMRPPSRSSGMSDANGQQVVRPGSAQSMASASPRPMSAGLAGGQ